MPSLDGKTASAALRAGNNAGMLYKRMEKSTLESLKREEKKVLDSIKAKPASKPKSSVTVIKTTTTVTKKTTTTKK